MFENILSLYGLDPDKAQIQSFGDGLINHTWKVNTAAKSYILQKVNHQVFKDPSAIDQNLTMLNSYLNARKPDYLFISPLTALNGDSLIQWESGYYRLFPFVEGSRSLNTLTKAEEAYEAAKQFGKFTRILADFKAEELNITIPDFHNLSLRFEQFNNACTNASSARLVKAADCIAFINEHQEILHTYHQLLNDQNIPLRVIHHDTKINNVLFDTNEQGLCVIDLDTVMPGYFISDVGDMMRTYLCAASEEETDFGKIAIRKDFFKAIYNGYMEEMSAVLTPEEQQYFTYSGKFIIYMQAIRFLTDYLENDHYYGAKYEDQNINRAKNQIVLLKAYLKVEQELIEEILIK